MLAYPYRGWWQPADTVKERHALEAAYLAGTRPWMLWELPERDPLQALIQAELER
jgi:glucose-1-phosphate cytidylyltransferase